MDAAAQAVTQAEQSLASLKLQVSQWGTQTSNQSASAVS